MLARCARGLAAAHEAGLVHCDFKPANVVLDHDGEPKIVDFGLARAGGEIGPADTHESLVDESFTQGGAITGTPRYMAPELWRGDAPSPASDQLAFCVALYELVAGRPPYEPRRFEVAPSRPAKVNGRLWAVLRRGLDPEAQARWGSMREVADRIDAAIEAPRGRLAWVLGGATAAAAVIGLASISRDEPEVRDEAAASAAASEVSPCPVGADLLGPERTWTGDEPSAIARDASELRLVSGAAPARAFVSAHLTGPPMSYRDRALELEVVAAPTRGEAHELIFGLKDEADVFMAGILVMGGRWAFPLAPGLRELSIEIGPRDRFFRIQVQTTPGQPETVTFETSQDRRAWRPIARTLARVAPGRPFVTMGSQSDMAVGDAAVVRALSCRDLEPVAEIPYDRDLARARVTGAEPTTQDPAPVR